MREFLDLRLFGEEAAPEVTEASPVPETGPQSAAETPETENSQPAEHQDRAENALQEARERWARERAEGLYRSWMEQAQQTRAVYPGFDLRRELGDPRFAALLRSKVDLRTAYEVLHKDEILAGAMRYAAQRVEQRLTDRFLAGRFRPAENGGRTQSAPHSTDVSKLSRADRQEIIRRVQKGEKIKF